MTRSYISRCVHIAMTNTTTPLICELQREEAFQDLFSVLQPKARLEDLVRMYGTAAGIISVSSSTGNAIVASAPCPSSSPSSSAFPSIPSPPSPSSPSRAFSRPRYGPGARVTRRVPFSLLSCSFSPRTAGLVLTSKNGKRTIVEVTRERDEKLEIAAKRLVKGLEGWVRENYTTTI